MHDSDPADTDDFWMRHALDLARRAEQAGEVPVGALIVQAGEVIGEGWNHNITANDPSAHAEVQALRDAGRRLGNYRFPGATLYVTLEPCPMCLGAVLQTRLVRLVYGADNVREGALGSVMDLRYGRWKRSVEVEGGVLAAESARLLQEFFAGRR